MIAEHVTLQFVHTRISSGLREYAMSIQKEMREKYGYDTNCGEIERSP